MGRVEIERKEVPTGIARMMEHHAGVPRHRLVERCTPRAMHPNRRRGVLGRGSAARWGMQRWNEVPQPIWIPPAPALRWTTRVSSILARAHGQAG